MKTCSRCGKDKVYEEFYKNRSMAGGCTAYCILCTKERNKRISDLKKKRMPDDWKTKTMDIKAYQIEYRKNKLEKDPDYWKRAEIKKILRDPDYYKKQYQKIIKSDPDYFRRRYKKKDRITLTSEEVLKRRSARRRLQKYVARGKIVKLPCKVCGSIEVEAHHQNYDLSYEVIWLCRRHHLDRHKKIR